jgi:hypothetical protein
MYQSITTGKKSVIYVLLITCICSGKNSLLKRFRRMLPIYFKKALSCSRASSNDIRKCRVVSILWKAIIFSGTTLLLGILDGDQFWMANVGDSRGVYCTDSGQAVPLSFDHKPCQVDASLPGRCYPVSCDDLADRCFPCQKSRPYQVATLC